MFEKEAKEYMHKDGTESEKLLNTIDLSLTKRQAFVLINICKQCFKDGAEFGYNKAKEWHYVRDGDLPKQDGHTCFSIEVLADNKKWVHYRFDFAKWFCGDKEVRVNAWKEIVLPKEIKENE